MEKVMKTAAPAATNRITGNSLFRKAGEGLFGQKKTTLFDTGKLTSSLSIQRKGEGDTFTPTVKLTGSSSLLIFI